MVEASKAAMRLGAHQLAYIHDELQYSCNQKVADEFGKAVTSAATTAGQQLNLNIRIDAEYRIGNNWAETH
jgi:DNA polymerase I-like protein with 3'-5' exonuclease and polymerase domains